MHLVLHKQPNYLVHAVAYT
ncbi:hypothetical protein F383_17802 [Gossypium arboreum]|uniref:Uncharacterized protein n=1 Tax=Gossypium arboreum TaxID=29729 RepID=A0A0B0MIW7_GOSAR|nr:hypothetical protein F383_17802 [Gossypium arboreum]